VESAREAKYGGYATPSWHAHGKALARGLRGWKRAARGGARDVDGLQTIERGRAIASQAAPGGRSAEAAAPTTTGLAKTSNREVEGQG